MDEAGHTIYGRVQAILDSGHPIPPVRLQTNQAFAGRCFCTRVLLHREGPSHRDGLKREMILQRDASTRRCSYTEMLSTQRCLYTQVARLHTGAFAQRCFYIELFLHTNTLRSAVTYKFFCAEILLHASTFTQTYFDNTLTHTDRSFTHKYFCTVRFFRTGAFSQMHRHTRMLFHREVFKRACFYTEVFSHNDIFTQRFSCTEMLSHTETLLHTYTFTQR